jgi:SAM-dependent methyltransferase
LTEQALYLESKRDEYAIGLAPADEIPVPPPELMEYKEAPDAHLQSGKREVASMLSILEHCSFSWERARRALEFGSNNGRLTRWLQPYAEGREIWGVDVQAEKVLWAMENLSPPFRFATTTTIPHLPFPDGHFDLIFAGSVFTHLGELHVAWMAELRRILAPGGLIYVTVHDEESVRILLEEPGRDRLKERIGESAFKGDLERGQFGFVSMAPYGNAMLSLVMMGEQHLLRIAQPLALVGRFPKAYSGFQTAYVFHAPDDPAMT